MKHMRPCTIRKFFKNLTKILIRLYIFLDIYSYHAEFEYSVQKHIYFNGFLHTFSRYSIPLFFLCGQS